MKDETHLPRNWAMTTVGEIYSIIGGGTPSTKVSEYWDGDIPWITSADISEDGKITPRKKVTKEGVTNSATNIVPEKSIIVVTRVGLGKLAVTEYPICFSQDSQALIPNNDHIYPRYAFYYLLQVVQIFKYSGRGTTISGVTKKQLGELPFKLPPLAEQKRIIEKIEELFTKLEASVEDLKSVKKKLDVYRKSVLKTAFDGKLLDINDEWIESKIDEVVKVRYGKGLPERERNKNGYIPVYGSAGNVGLHNNFLIDFPTIIVARKGSIGNNFIVKEPCWAIDTVYYLENITVDIDYLFHVLNFSIFKDTSTAVPSLRRDDLENIPIRYPSKKENQKQIVQEIESRFSVIDKLEKTVDNTLTKQEQLRKSILKNAFEGKLAPQDPSDEPAKILLKRMQKENGKYEQMRLN